MTARRHIFVLALLLAGLTESARPEGWKTEADASVYAYAGSTQPHAHSVLNPDNRIAGIARSRVDTEVRIGLRAESDSLRLSLRPILSLYQASGDTGQEAYLSQWQLRWRTSPTSQLAVGRDLLTWGPAQFRSPSNPFYFDSGRSNPMRELSGVDVLKFSWTPDVLHSVQLVRLTGSGHRQPWLASRDDGWLLKADWRNDGRAAGLAIAHSPERAPFYGAHVQYSPSDAWLLYGEVGSGSRDQALMPPRNPEQPFEVQAESPRHTRQLLGASYSLDNGHSLSLEYLHSGDGYSRDALRAYFKHAAAASLSAPGGAQTLGLALTAAPPLLGRDYLHLVWQNSLLDEQGYWRLMLTRSFTDNSLQASGYAEIPASSRLSVFALGTLPAGHRQSEFAALIGYSLTLGIKLALP